MLLCQTCPVLVLMQVIRAGFGFPSRVGQKTLCYGSASPPDLRAEFALYGDAEGYKMTDVAPQTYLTEDALTAERPTWPAIRRGFACRCPKCGQGALLHSYLKVRDSCAVCGEVYSHQRADDGPAYLTILVVGHLMAPLMLYVFTTYRPEPWIMASFFTLGTGILSLVLLPRFKGAMVALQWAKRMHGFSADTLSESAGLTHV